MCLAHILYVVCTTVVQHKVIGTSSQVLVYILSCITDLYSNEPLSLDYSKTPADTTATLGKP